MAGGRGAFPRPSLAPLSNFSYGQLVAHRRGELLKIPLGRCDDQRVGQRSARWITLNHNERGLNRYADREKKTPANDALRQIYAYAFDHGLIFQTRGTRGLQNVIRLVPAMTTTDEEIDRALSILNDAIGAVVEVCRRRGLRFLPRQATGRLLHGQDAFARERCRVQLACDPNCNLIARVRAGRIFGDPRRQQRTAVVDVGKIDNLHEGFFDLRPNRLLYWAL